MRDAPATVAGAVAVVRIGHRGDRWFELGTWLGRAGGSLRFVDSAGALLFLRQQLMAGDLRRLRQLVGREDPTALRLDDTAVLQRVAQRLVRGQLAAVLRYDIRESVPLQQVWEPPEAVLPAPEPRVSPPPPTLPPPEPVAPINGAAQAVALRQAATDGTPFCEECAKAQLAKAAASRQPTSAVTADGAAQATPVAARPPSPAMTADAAQAVTLRTAAAKGTPFCAICEAAKAKAKANANNSS